MGLLGSIWFDGKYTSEAGVAHTARSALVECGDESVADTITNEYDSDTEFFFG